MPYALRWRLALHARVVEGIDRERSVVSHMPRATVATGFGLTSPRCAVLVRVEELRGRLEET
jgi:hypothetical protein